MLGTMCRVPLHRENWETGKMAKLEPNCVCSSCKKNIPDYKGITIFAVNISEKNLKLDKSAKSVFCTYT